MLLFGMLTCAIGLLFFFNVVILYIVPWSVIGLMLCATAVLQTIGAMQTRGRVPLIAWLPFIAFHMLFGLFVLTAPKVPFIALSFAFFVGLILCGLMRSYCGYLFRPIAGWQCLAAGGSTSALIGLLLISQWPRNTLSFAGALLALDLVAYGLGFLGFALAVGTQMSREQADR